MPRAQAERIYRASVDRQRLADATGIPRLFVAAEAAISVLRAAPDEKARGATWLAVQKAERVAAELDAFRTAVKQEFSEENMRQMLRAGGRPGRVSASQLRPNSSRPRIEWPS